MVCINPEYFKGYVESFRGRMKSARHSRGVANWRDEIARLTGLKSITGGAGGGWGTQAWGSTAWGGGGTGGTASNTYYEYDPASNLSKKTLDNGIFTYFAYDAANRVTNIQNCKSDGTPVCYFEYNYDAASRIDRVRREDGTNIYYEYDNNNRLTNEHWVDSGNTTIYSFEWDYDAVGNRSYQKNGTVETYYSYDVANQVNNYNKLGTGYSYFTHDANGNMLTWQRPSGTTYYSYNDAQLIESIHYSNDTWAYFHYDGLDRCYAINDSNGLSYLTWDTNGDLLAESDNTGTVKAKYTHGYSPVETIGNMVQQEHIVSGTSHYRYDEFDHRGSVVKQTDENENIVTEYEYNAFGYKLKESNPSGVLNRTQYQSKFALGENLYWFKRRVYSAELGRFIQRDPDGKGSAENLYEYCRNEPTFYVDVEGSYPSDEVVAQKAASAIVNTARRVRDAVRNSGAIERAKRAFQRVREQIGKWRERDVDYGGAVPPESIKAPEWLKETKTKVGSCCDKPSARLKETPFTDVSRSGLGIRSFTEITPSKALQMSVLGTVPTSAIGLGIAARNFYRVHATLSIEFENPKDVRDLKWAWWSCWRRRFPFLKAETGYYPDHKTFTPTLNVFIAMGPQGGLIVSSHLTWLSCEDVGGIRKWVRKYLFCSNDVFFSWLKGGWYSESPIGKCRKDDTRRRQIFGNE